jgi:hypothetical protein
MKNNMPLLPGTHNIRKNIKELNLGQVGSARKKAIETYAKKHNLSKEDAKFKLSLIIAKSVATKKHE